MLPSGPFFEGGLFKIPVATGQQDTREPMHSKRHESTCRAQRETQESPCGVSCTREYAKHYHAPTTSTTSTNTETPDSGRCNAYNQSTENFKGHYNQINGTSNQRATTNATTQNQRSDISQRNIHHTPHKRQHLQTPTFYFRQRRLRQNTTTGHQMGPKPKRRKRLHWED